MSYPFPGMNPWLEDSRLWKGVHTRLLTRLGDTLAAQLEPRYFVDVESHTYISTASDAPASIRYPDITISDRGDFPPQTGLSTTILATPLEIELPEIDSTEQRFLEIRSVQTGELITVIELLSHANKRAGNQRDSYLEKRKSYLNADLNFVEIDLLRANKPMPYTEQLQPSTTLAMPTSLFGQRPSSHYRLFVHRRDHPSKAFIYAFNVRDAVPIFPLPLQEDDAEPAVDLGRILSELYDNARYKLIVDYTQSPSPELSQEDTAWAEKLLKTKQATNGAR
ncbi:MAG: DUF4058 family protein [Chloroflexota bacterium]